MPKSKALQAGATRYALEIVGQQDEYGLCENAYRFQASIVSLVGKSDLSVIQGLLIPREAPGDLCVRIKHAADGSVFCKPIEIFQGAAASEMIRKGVDVSMQVRCEKVLFLHHPSIVDVNDELQPGFRLLAALKRRLNSESIDVVVDLGTTEESKEFNDYFFPNTEFVDLEFHNLRLLRGHWGQTSKNRGIEYNFGVIYA